MLNIEAPCRDCKRRKVGCHNEETCPEWKEYREKCEEAKAKAKKIHQSCYLVNYDKAEEIRKIRRMNHRLKKLRRK